VVTEAISPGLVAQMKYLHRSGHNTFEHTMGIMACSLGVFCYSNTHVCAWFLDAITCI
jgi:hypothetical protein